LFLYEAVQRKDTAMAEALLAAGTDARYIELAKL